MCMSVCILAWQAALYSGNTIVVRAATFSVMIFDSKVIQSADSYVSVLEVTAAPLTGQRIRILPNRYDVASAVHVVGHKLTAVDPSPAGLKTLSHRAGHFSLLYQNFCGYHGHALHPGSSCRANLCDAAMRRERQAQARRRVSAADKQRSTSYAAALKGSSSMV